MNEDTDSSDPEAATDENNNNFRYSPVCAGEPQIINIVPLGDYAYMDASGGDGLMRSGDPFLGDAQPYINIEPSM